jgi:hypothetical protein
MPIYRDERNGDIFGSVADNSLMINSIGNYRLINLQEGVLNL